jgi:hypothetical protein
MRVGAAVVVALTLVALPAAAQSNGDSVRIETSSGVVEGTLIDKLPDGYLVRVGDATQVVRYTDVKSIAPVTAPVVDPPPEPLPPPVAPEPPPPPPPPVVAPVKKEAKSPGLVAGGAVALSFGALGALTGAVMLPIGLVLSSSNQCKDPTGTKTFDCEYGNASDLALAGGIVLGASVALLAGGIVMIAVGSAPKRVGTLQRVGALTWSF